MDPNTDDTKLIFEKKGVYLYTTANKANQNSTILGYVRIMERAGEPYLEWSPLEDEMRIAPTAIYSKKYVEREEKDTKFDPGYEPDWMIISTVKKEQENVPAQDPGLWSFSLPLSDLYCIRRTQFCLVRNLLILTSRGGHLLPPLCFNRGETQGLFRALHRYIILDQSPVDRRLFLAYPHKSCTLSQPLDKLCDDDPDLVSRFAQDPYATTLSGFSKVTNMFRAALRFPESPVLLKSVRNRSPTLQSDEDSGFEFISCQTKLGPRPDVTRGQAVDNWVQFLDPESRVMNPEKIKLLVFRGGIIPSLRKEVWKFLLGFYPWNSTAKERENILRAKSDEYFRMKMQWKSISEGQERRNSIFRGYRSLIERDVSRTDRHVPFFTGKDNPALTLLHDVLMTYCMYNFDLGYVQGMSDLLSPILYVTQDEVESFWCFAGFMKMVHQNFEESMETMKQQLLQFNILLKALDPELCDFLDSQDSGSLCFCFRWLLIWFKREFAFEDILILWEALWTRLPCENFHLLIACAMMLSQRGELIGSKHDLNTILKHINELTLKLDLQSILCTSESIYLQLIQGKEPPLKVQQILGLYSSCSSQDSAHDIHVINRQQPRGTSQAGEELDEKKPLKVLESDSTDLQFSAV